MVREGVLQPADAGKFIAENALHVKVHQEGLIKLCKEMLNSISNNKLEIPDTGADSIHPKLDDSRIVDWIFVLDTLNFCFWSPPKSNSWWDVFKFWSKASGQKWTVDGFTGYYALEAALSRVMQYWDGFDMTNPECYTQIDRGAIEYIMRGDNEVRIPLLEERVAVLHEVGKILIEKFDGTFKTCIKMADKSAVKLLEIIVDNFPCFQDEAVFKGQKVALYKRAQILVADLWNFFKGESYGEFHDIDKLTMFADYRVPQVLVYFGAMSYSDELMAKLKKDELLPPGSEEEVEIRGCSIHAVELLKKMLKEEIKVQNLNAEVPNSSLIDYYLWSYRRKFADELEVVPFHKTLGIYY